MNYIPIRHRNVSPSNPVTVTFVIPIPRDELTYPFIIDVIDSHAITSYPLSFSKPLPSSDVSIEVDVRCPHPGVFQVAKRLQGQANSEQRWGFVVQDEND